MKNIWIIPINNNITKKELFAVLAEKLNTISFDITIKDEIFYFTKKIKFTTHTGQNKMELFKFLRKGQIELKENENDNYVKISVSQSFIATSTTILSLVLFAQLKFLIDASYLQSFIASIIFFSLYYFIGYSIANFQIRQLVHSTLIQIGMDNTKNLINDFSSDEHSWE